MKRKKISDEMAAAIFAFIWEGFLYFAVITQLVTGSARGYYWLLLDTAVQTTILIYDAKVQALEKSLTKTRKRLAKQSAEFTEYIKTHEAAEKKTVTIFDIKPIIEHLKRRKSA